MRLSLLFPPVLAVSALCQAQALRQGDNAVADAVMQPTSLLVQPERDDSFGDSTKTVFARISSFFSSKQEAHVRQKMITEVDFKQELVVCNAYPSENTKFQVFKGELSLTAAEGDLAYKKCRTFPVALKKDESLDFKVAGANAGSFTVSELPTHDAVLLLVISRHDQHSSAVDFDSHVFAAVQNPQLAILDTYRGNTTTGQLRIKDQAGAAVSRSEALKFDSVVAINPGDFQLVVVDSGVEKASANVTASNKHSYVVLRVGVDSDTGAKWPQELVVYDTAAALRTAYSCLVAVGVMALSLVM